MSATAGPPPNPYIHGPDRGRPATVKHGYAVDMGKRSDKVFKSLDEILAVRPNINVNSPMRTILSEGDQHAKQADSFFDFRRPDFALEEYLKASIIAVEIIPRHKDYPALQYDRGEMHRLYSGLKKRISTQQDRFDEAKKLIKENNAQNGATLPATQSDHTNPVNGDVEAVRARTNFFDSVGDKGRASNHLSSHQKNGLGNSRSETGADPSKSNNQIVNGKKPAVHPKPEALQGRSIKPKSPPKSIDDLTTRFTRLRGIDTGQIIESSPSKLAPVQDPRIRTRPIVLPSNSGAAVATNRNSAQPHSRAGGFSSEPNRPLGSRESPIAPQKPLKIALGVEIPQMPRQPEAVYSPARNMDSNPHGEFLSENHPSFSSSVTRISPMDSKKDSGRGFMNVDDVKPYFLTSPTPMQAAPLRPRLPDLSSLKNITAQQLHDFMQIGSHELSILLVDIRNREDFDSGHILWQSIICIEPITLRTGVSADDIEQSLVISPDAEQKLYMQRHTFSLVVYYDRSSCSSSISPRGNGTILQEFHRAIYDFAYEKRLQNRPLRLEGGLDAWIDLVGEGALATSKSALAANTLLGAQNLRSFVRETGFPGAKNRITGDSSTGSRGNEMDRSLEQPIRSPGIEGQDFLDDSYFKSAEDFMRRYPAVSEIKESMVLPSNRLILASGPPKRPEKAVTPGETPHVYSRLTSKQPATDFPDLWGSGRTGLYNRDNLCYMNSAIQALSSIYELRDYLFRGSWVKEPPKQTDGSLVDQQLATRTFSNLLMHLWSKDAARCSYINPRTFVATINRLHLHALGPSRNDLFGGPSQLDSSEFIDFLVENLCRETTKEDASTKPWTDADEQYVEEAATLSEAADRAIKLSTSQGQSPIAALICHMFVKMLQCNICNKKMQVFDRTSTSMTILNFPSDLRGGSTVAFNDLLRHGRQEDPLQGYTCKHCNQSNVRQLDILYVRPPPILIMRLLRGRNEEIKDPKTNKVIASGATSKIREPVAFPEKLDMSKYQIPKRTAIYDCFAVVSHIGTDLKSGHNVSYRRDLAKEGNRWAYRDWWHYNDTQTSRCSFEDIDKTEAYVLFYRLRDAHFS